MVNKNVIVKLQLNNNDRKLLVSIDTKMLLGIN